MERDPFALFGVEIFSFQKGPQLNLLLMVRFGDLARIEGGVWDVRVTMKNGAVFDLSRTEASDFDDGLKVWDKVGDPISLDSLRVRATSRMA